MLQALSAAQIIPSGEHYSQHGGIGVLFLNLVCAGGPDAQGVDHRATTSWVSKPSLLMRAFTLPVGVLHISTVLECVLVYRAPALWHLGGTTSRLVLSILRFLGSFSI